LHATAVISTTGEQTLARRKPFKSPIDGTCCAISRMYCGDSWIAILGKSPMPGNRQFPGQTHLSLLWSFLNLLPQQLMPSGSSVTHGADHFMTRSTFSADKESPNGQLLASWKWIERRSNVICGQVRTRNDHDPVAGRRLIRFEWCFGIVGVKDAETRRNSIVNW
jgi:hypothetical protein